MPILKESTVENHVVRYARERGVPVTKLNLLGQRGWPDRVFWLSGGRPLLVEFKRPGTELRPLQNRRMSKLLRNGYDVLWCDDAEAGIDELRRRGVK